MIADVLTLQIVYMSNSNMKKQKLTQTQPKSLPGSCWSWRGLTTEHLKHIESETSRPLTASAAGNCGGTRSSAVRKGEKIGVMGINTSRAERNECMLGRVLGHGCYGFIQSFLLSPPLAFVDVSECRKRCIHGKILKSWRVPQQSEFFICFSMWQNKTAVFLEAWVLACGKNWVMGSRKSNFLTNNTERKGTATNTNTPHTCP